MPSTTSRARIRGCGIGAGGAPTVAAARGALAARLALALLLALAVMIGPAAIDPSAVSARAVTGAAARPSAVVPPASAAAQRTPATRPGGPPAEPQSTSPVSLQLLSLGPGSLGPGDMLTASVRVTNTSATSIENPGLELRVYSGRLSERTALDSWQRDTDPTPSGKGPQASSTPDPTPLGPGESRDFTVSVSADFLHLPSDPSEWGARRAALTATGTTASDATSASSDGTGSDTASGRSGQQPLGTLRSFVVWRPAEATASIRRSVLVPLASADPGLAAQDPKKHDAELASGPLAAAGAFGAQAGVDWILDPSLLDPPSLGTVEDTGKDTGKGAAPSQEPSASASPSPSPSVAPGDASDGQDGSDGDDPASPTPSSSTKASTAVDPRTYAPTPRANVFAKSLRRSAHDRTILTLPYDRADLPALADADAPALKKALTDRTTAALGTAKAGSAGTVGMLDAATASPAEADALVGAGASVLVIPSSSLRHDTGITRSGIGVLRTSHGTVPVLAPDPGLSAQLSSMSDPAALPASTQRMLAETAVIASQDGTAPRQLLMMLDPTAGTDAAAATKLLAALDDAPWIDPTPTSALLDAASGATASDGSTSDESSSGRMTTDPYDERNGRLLGLGTIDAAKIAPSRAQPDGSWGTDGAGAPPKRRPRVPAVTIRSADATVARIEQLASAMSSPAQTSLPLALALASVSSAQPGGEEGSEKRAADASHRVDVLYERISVVPASGYNVVAASAGAPVTLRNDLDSDLTVRVHASSGNPVVRIGKLDDEVTIQAHTQKEVSIPVTAVATGSAELTVSVSTPDGTELSAPRTVKLSVNPSWENWTTLLMVVAMGALVVVGILRARRVGSDRRAPAVRGPEDPAVLSVTGISTPAPSQAPRWDDDAQHSGDRQPPAPETGSDASEPDRSTNGNDRP